MKPGSFAASASLAAGVLLLTGCASTAIHNEPHRFSDPIEKSLVYLEFNQRYHDLRKETERRLAAGDKPTATLLGYNCIAYGKLKEYSKLFGCLEKLERRIQSGDASFVSSLPGPFQATANARPLPDMLRAEAWLEFGEYRKAIASGTKALEAVSDSDGGSMSLWLPARFRLTILSVLVLAAEQTGDKQLSQRFVQQLEAVSIPLMGRGVWANMRDNALARAYMAVGRYDKALDAMGGGLAGSLTASVVAGIAGYSSGDNPLTISVLPRLLMRSKALAATGRTGEAKAALDELLSLPRIGDVGDIYWVALFERGRVAEQEGNRKQAIELYRKAVEVIEAQRASINTEAAKIGFVGDKQAVYQRLIAALFAEGQYAVAFEYIERSKARALVDMLASKQDFAVAHGNASEVRTLLARADTAEAEGRAQDFSAETGKQRSLAIQARQRLIQQAPELSSLVTVTPVTVQEIQGKLPSDEVLVEYYAEGKEVYAFVLSKAGLRGIKLDGEALVADVQNFRQALQDTRSTRTQELAGKLYNRLVKPLEGAINQRNVLVVAHGPLHYLPFNALHDGNGYLIERYSIRQLPSASVLKYFKGVKPQTTGTLLAFGNPDLGDPGSTSSTPRRKPWKVAKVLPNSKALVRKDANLSAFKRYGGGFRYLHFASHGEFNADNPLNSALLLSPDGRSDGRLTVSELYSTRLEADLVTLSACETGLGKIANGDDVVGLTRGFLYAGSRSIVASLWKVDDEATAYLMTRFYGALKGTSKREALRLAQIETRKKYPHPYYWAAFQLTGEAN
jgi:CHAT domain-containing protein